VLLGAGSFGRTCSDNIIRILSVSFLAGACVLSVVLVLLFSNVPWLNRYFSGFRRNAKSLKEVETAREEESGLFHPATLKRWVLMIKSSKLL